MSLKFNPFTGSFDEAGSAPGAPEAGDVSLQAAQVWAWWGGPLPSVVSTSDLGIGSEDKPIGNTTENSGYVEILSGEILDASSIYQVGGIELKTGNHAGAGSVNQLLIRGGDSVGGGGGNIQIQAGTGFNAANSGIVTIASGSTQPIVLGSPVTAQGSITPNAAQTLNLGTDALNFSSVYTRYLEGATGGALTVYGPTSVQVTSDGDVTFGPGASGVVNVNKNLDMQLNEIVNLTNIRTLDATANGNTGNLLARTGHNTFTGNSGSTTISTGDATTGNSGDVSIATGTASGTRGKISLDGNGLKLPAQSAEPDSASNGMIYYDTDIHNFRGYANGAWVDMSSAIKTKVITVDMSQGTNGTNGASTVIGQFTNRAILKRGYAFVSQAFVDDGIEASIEFGPPSALSYISGSTSVFTLNSVHENQPPNTVLIAAAENITVRVVDSNVTAGIITLIFEYIEV